MRRLSTEQQERLLAGAPFAVGGELNETASFMRALPAYIHEEPNEVLSEALVPRLAEEARTSLTRTEARGALIGAHLGTRRARPRRALVARVAVAVALLPASMAALAVAGVHVPKPAQDAFEGVGVELPNQTSDAGSTSTGDPSDAEEGDSGATSNEKAKGKRGKPAKPGNEGKALGHQKKGKAKGGGNGNAFGHGDTPPARGGGKGSSQGNKGGASSKAKTPPGQAKKQAKPPPPGKGKSK